MIRVDQARIYQYIKAIFEDIEAEVDFREFPDPDGDPLANKTQPPYLRMRVKRYGYAAEYNFDLIEFHRHLQSGELPLVLETIKEKVEKAFKIHLKNK